MDDEFEFGTAAGPTGRSKAVNTLNDLDAREWLRTTKSIWYENLTDLQVPALEAIAAALRQTVGDEATEKILGQVLDSILVSKPGPRDKLKALHPATFPETDVERLIRFFTKEGEQVLDPFVGSGSTLVAARHSGRGSLGIELIPRWAEIAEQRANSQLCMFDSPTVEAQVRLGDARTVLRGLPDESYDLVLTSPPYWSMLNKPADHKMTAERVSRNLPTNYSSSEVDLANIETYQDFLDQLGEVFAQCVRVLKPMKYIVVIVSDFRHKSQFIMYHADVGRMLERLGMTLAGVTILVQDSKTLYPYGMPHTFVSNIHHQYVVVARKLGR